MTTPWHFPPRYSFSWERWVSEWRELLETGAIKDLVRLWRGRETARC